MGRVIRVLRRRRGLAIEVLAFAAGLHPTYLSSIEREGRNLSLMKLWALADALGVSLGQMAGWRKVRRACDAASSVSSPTSGRAANTGTSFRRT
jgi:transcriptional regulator with XRE-family HTH domain